MRSNPEKVKEVKILDCECNGSSCCGGRGIAVFQVNRNGKILKVCTRCDFSSDKDKKILRYVKKLPAKKLMDFDALGTFCLVANIRDKDYPFTKGLYGDY